MTDRATDAGFTLLETLVALAVLAVGAVGLLGVVDGHVARTGAVADRIAMRWIAGNALAADALGLPQAPGWHSALGVDYVVSTARAALDGTRLEQRIVQVTAPGGTAVATLRGYVLTNGDRP